ncbi:transporter substrate-binding domain-containing protein [Bartonella sp. DGB2]|uniref:transporter substrate-binding domain-containing protein n=1 Tax=Bartonella sp. DGB2 TaxID=3388426 RepID=UPI00398FEE48
MKKIRNLIYFFSFLTLMTPSFSMAQTDAKPERLIKIGTEGTYRPWTMADADGKVTGFDADLAAALCSKLHAKCQFVVQNFDSLIPSLITGRFQLIMTSISATQEREKQIAFSHAYAAIPNVFATRKGSSLTQFKTLDALKKGLVGKRVGVLSGATQAQYLIAEIPETKIMPYDTMDQMLLDLSARRLDVGFADETVWDEFFSKPQGRNLVTLEPRVNPEDAPTILGYGIAIGIAKENIALKDEVNQALCDLLDNGAVKKISEKWLHKDISVSCIRK